MSRVRERVRVRISVSVSARPGTGNQDGCAPGAGAAIPRSELPSQKLGCERGRVLIPIPRFPPLDKQERKGPVGDEMKRTSCNGLAGPSLKPSRVELRMEYVLDDVSWML